MECITDKVQELHIVPARSALLVMGQQQHTLHCSFPTNKSTFEQHFPTSDKLKVRVLLFEPLFWWCGAFLVYPPYIEVHGVGDLWE